MPTRLREALEAGRIVPFVGAGVSMAVRRSDGRPLFPSWKGLLEGAIERLEASAPGSPHLGTIKGNLAIQDYLEAAKAARIALKSEWPEFLADALDPDLGDDVEPTLALARAVWSLGSPLVITTNYDRVLEVAAPIAAPGRWVVASPGGEARFLADRLSRPTVWHLHGHIDDPTRLVLDRDAYARLYGTTRSGDGADPAWASARETLGRISADRPLLFIGFSLGDPAIRDLLTGMQRLYEGAAPTPYLVCRRDEADGLRALCQQVGLDIHLVEVADFGQPMVDCLLQMAGVAGGESAMDQVPPPPRATLAAPEGTDWPAASTSSPLRARFAATPALARQVEALILQCATARDDAQRRIAAAFGPDPWYDPNVVQRTWTALDALTPAGEATALEAALLVTAPAIAEAVRQLGFAALAERARLHELAPSDAVDGPRHLLEQVHRGHPALLRRAARFDTPSIAAAVGAWLGWRAVARMTHLWGTRSETPADPAASLLASLDLGPVTRYLPTLARAVGAGPERLDSEGGARTHHDLSIDGQPVRLASLGQLLALASAAALDARLLDTVAVDHLGADPHFDLDRLRSMLATARWTRGPAAWTLERACHHPVEQHALVQLAERADMLADDLRPGPRVDRCRLLGWWPGALTAAGVGPMTGEEGHPAYHPVLVQFRLDHRRVREMLIGQRLYGDPLLAVRELYQNALDACRLRRAREAWLRWTDDTYCAHHGPYAGEIIFRQGHDADGRAFIECVDDGAGMSRLTLERVFAVAGKRFHDQPTFLEERARWTARLALRKADPDTAAALSFVPNSQHGIGVLSYFMLADDLEITTRCLSPDGGRGEPLKVSICSANGLFRVEPAPAGTPLGTTVRLFLAREEIETSKDYTRRVSAVDALTSVLMVAEYPTRVDVQRGADEYVTEMRWAPGRAHPKVFARWYRRHGDEPGPDRDGRQPSSPACWPAMADTARSAVWWTNVPQAAVLVDGLLTEARHPWLMVDLRGERRPKLSVDRRTIAAWDAAWVAQAVAGSMTTLPGPGCTFQWLWYLLSDHPTLGRAAHEALLTIDPTLPVGESSDGEFSADRLPAEQAPHAPYSAIGWCPWDASMISTNRGWGAPALPSPRLAERAGPEDSVAASRLGAWSPHLGAPWGDWRAAHRLTACVAPVGGAALGGSPGRPSDNKHLEYRLDGPDLAAGLRAALRVRSHAGLPSTDLKLALGFLDAGLRPGDLDWMSQGPDGLPPWRTDRFTGTHLIEVAERSGRALSACAQALTDLARRLGQPVSWDLEAIDALDWRADDLDLLVALKHHHPRRVVFGRASASAESPRVVAGRLATISRAVGLDLSTTDDETWPTEPPTADDVALLGMCDRRLGYAGDGLSESAGAGPLRVKTKRLLEAARANGQGLDELGRQLDSLGLSLAAPASELRGLDLSDADVALLAVVPEDVWQRGVLDLWGWSTTSHWVTHDPTRSEHLRSLLDGLACVRIDLPDMPSPNETQLFRMDHGPPGVSRGEQVAVHTLRTCSKKMGSSVAESGRRLERLGLALTPSARALVRAATDASSAGAAESLLELSDIRSRALSGYTGFLPPGIADSAHFYRFPTADPDTVLSAFDLVLIARTRHTTFVGEMQRADDLMRQVGLPTAWRSDARATLDMARVEGVLGAFMRTPASGPGHRATTPFVSTVDLLRSALTAKRSAHDLLDDLHALDGPLGLGLDLPPRGIGPALDAALEHLTAEDPPYGDWSPTEHLAEYCAAAVENINAAHLDPETALLYAGRRWLWWLADDALRPFADTLGPILIAEAARPVRGGLPLESLLPAPPPYLGDFDLGDDW